MLRPHGTNVDVLVPRAHVQCFSSIRALRPVKSEQRLGSFPLFCGSALAFLHCGKRASTAIHCSFRPARMARPHPHFCAAPSVATLPNVCLALSRSRFCVLVCSTLQTCCSEFTSCTIHRVKKNDTPCPGSQRHGEEERRPKRHQITMRRATLESRRSLRKETTTGKLEKQCKRFTISRGVSAFQSARRSHTTNGST